VFCEQNTCQNTKGSSTTVFLMCYVITRAKDLFITASGEVNMSAELTFAGIRVSSSLAKLGFFPNCRWHMDCRQNREVRCCEKTSGTWCTCSPRLDQERMKNEMELKIYTKYTKIMKG